MLSCPQATTYKLDFEQERTDRQEAMGRFDGERVAFQKTIENLSEKMRAMYLEHDNTVAQLEQLKETSVQNKAEVRGQITPGSSICHFVGLLQWYVCQGQCLVCVCVCVCASVRACMCVDGSSKSDLRCSTQLCGL